jgi:hypothetical protein
MRRGAKPLGQWVFGLVRSVRVRASERTERAGDPEQVNVPAHDGAQRAVARLPGSVVLHGLPPSCEAREPRACPGRLTRARSSSGAPHREWEGCCPASRGLTLELITCTEGSPAAITYQISRKYLSHTGTPGRPPTLKTYCVAAYVVLCYSARAVSRRQPPARLFAAIARSSSTIARSFNESPR